MKATKPSYNSFRRLLSAKSSKDIGKGNEMGRTILPVGAGETTVRLPSVEDTATYSVLKTPLMEDSLNIVNSSVRGSLKGLLLNEVGGILSVQSVGFPTQKFAMSATSPNGAEMDFLSNGKDWFFWGFLADGDIQQSVIGDFGGEKDANQNTIPDWIDQYLRDSGVDTENLTPEQAEEFTEQIYNSVGSSPGGGSGEGSGASITIPPSPPTLSSSEDFTEDGSSTNENVWSIGGEEAVPGSTIQIIFYDDQGIEEASEEVVVAPDGTWSIEQDISEWVDGGYTADITITNPNTGQVSPPTTVGVTIDRTPPAVSFNGSSPFSFLLGQAPADPGLTIEEEATYTSTWDTQGLNGLALGQQSTITYTITDSAGNVSTLEVQAFPTSTAEGNIPLAPLSGPATYVDGVFSSNGATYTHDGITLDDDLTVFSFWFRNDEPSNKAAITLLSASTNSTSVTVTSNGVTLGGVLAGSPLDTSTLSTPIDVLDGEWHHLAIIAQRNYTGNNEPYRMWVSVDGEKSNLFYVSGTADIIPLDGSGQPGSLEIGQVGRSISLSQFEILENKNPSPAQIAYVYNDGVFGKLIEDGISNQADERTSVSVIYENIEETPSIINNYDTIVSNGWIVDGVATLNIDTAPSSPTGTSGSPSGEAYTGLNGYKFDLFHYDPSKMEGRTISAWFNLVREAPLKSLSVGRAGSVRNEGAIFSKAGYHQSTSDGGFGGWTIAIQKNNDDVNNIFDQFVFTTSWRFPNNGGVKEVFSYPIEETVGHSEFQIGTWYHVAVTFSGGLIRFYINGQEVGTGEQVENAVLRNFHTQHPSSKNPTGDPEGSFTLSKNSIPLQIGRTTVPGNFLWPDRWFPGGEIDKVGMYYGVMTQQEISDLYNSQDETAPVITLNGADPLVVVEGSVGEDPGATTNEGTLVTSDWSIDNQTQVGEYTISYNSTDGAGNQAETITRTVQVVAVQPISSGLILDNDLFNSTEQGSDRQGLTSLPSVNPSDDKVYSFDGGASFYYYNGYRYDPYDFSADPIASNYEYTGNARTYSIWFNSVDMSQPTKAIMSKFGRSGISGTIAGWSIHTNNGLIEVFVDSNNAAGIQASIVSYGDTSLQQEAILDSTWYHLVVTFNNGTAKIYLNGQLKNSGATGIAVETGSSFEGDATLYTQHNRQLTISGRAGTDNALLETGSEWVGSLGYPEIYYSELAPEQILGIYNSQVAAINAL